MGSLLVVAASLAFVVACGETASPTSPALTLGRSKQPKAQSQYSARLALCNIPHDVQVSKRIGPLGGTLDLGDNNTVYFPPGALLTDTTITALVPAGNTARVFFTPEGLRFPVAAIVTLNVSPCITPTALLSVVYLQADTVSEVRPTVNNPNASTVSAKIEHFSSYAVAY
ncbi:MAG: hypothetical protein ABI884_12695 [Gemmatimonadota bacterium]